MPKLKQTIKQRESLWLAALRSERDRREAEIRSKYPAGAAEAFIARARSAAQAGADSLYAGGTGGEGLARLLKP